MKRRDFVKIGGAGVASLVVGPKIPGVSDDPVHAAVPVQVLNFDITDALKNMATHNAINRAQCYFWIYKSNTPLLPPDCPGPMIFTTTGAPIQITINNKLDENHSFFIPPVPGTITPVADTGPIAPNTSKTITFNAPRAGTYLYFDNLNAPVNRVMGLHGAFIVMPAAPVAGHKFTPYDRPTPAIQRLFDDLGTAKWWPGLSWQAGDPLSHTPPFRQYVWLCSQASSRLFAEVGNAPPGTGPRVPAEFIRRFTLDPFRADGLNRKPEFFTISGQSGHFSHNNPYICPNNRVGEPSIIRVLNAGLNTHSMHIHANHVYVISVQGVPRANLWWVDTMTNFAMTSNTSYSGFDWLVPYMRPPDIPNIRGIGRADTPLTSIGANRHPVWPPVEELNTFIPPVGTKAGVIPIDVQLSPLCYPMHDHSEWSQVCQGGNYNMGLISGINFTGDRNTAAGVVTFPNEPAIHGPSKTGPPTVPF